MPFEFPRIPDYSSHQSLQAILDRHVSARMEAQLRELERQAAELFRKGYNAEELEIAVYDDGRQEVRPIPDRQTAP